MCCCLFHPAKNQPKVPVLQVCSSSALSREKMLLWMCHMLGSADAASNLGKDCISAMCLGAAACAGNYCSVMTLLFASLEADCWHRSGF